MNVNMFNIELFIRTFTTVSLTYTLTKMHKLKSKCFIFIYNMQFLMDMSTARNKFGFRILKILHKKQIENVIQIILFLKVNTVKMSKCLYFITFSALFYMKCSFMKMKKIEHCKLLMI